VENELREPCDGNLQKIPELWLPVPLEVGMKTYFWLNQNRLLSHLRTSFCVLAIAGGSLTLPSAEAGTPQPASGQFFPCFNYATAPVQVGEDLIISFDITGTSNGTFTGSVIGTELDVVHPDGSITLHGSILFTGSVTGRSGTGTMLFSYQGIGNAVTGHENLRFVGTQGTGALAGTYAQLTAEGNVIPPDPNSGCDLQAAGTYSGQILFGP